MVSLVAPTGKEVLTGSARSAKPNKKAKATMQVEEEDSEAVASSKAETLAGDSPPKRKTMRVTARTTRRTKKQLLIDADSALNDESCVAKPDDVVLGTLPLPPLEISSLVVSSYAAAMNTAMLATQSMKEAAVLATMPQYEWRTQINTTVFWIGEKPTDNNPTPNHVSSWDSNWSGSYGGFDDPLHRRGYLPADFTPKQNPFYFALPYNDVTAEGHKPEARDLIPWFDEKAIKDAATGRTKSMCKDRWIAIRKGDLVCYAQWEDAGPFTTDDKEYVFGGKRPKANANHGAGLDVSPAVRDYLKLDGEDVTDWKFVEVADIPHGPWALHGENNHFVQQVKRAPSVVMSEARKRSGDGT